MALTEEGQGSITERAVRLNAQRQASEEETRRVYQLEERERVRVAGFRQRIAAATAARDQAAVRLGQIRVEAGDEGKALAALDAAESDLAEARRLEPQIHASETALASLESKRSASAKQANESTAALRLLHVEALQQMADEWATRWLRHREATEAMVVEAMALDQLLEQAGAAGGLAVPLLSPMNGLNVPLVRRGEARDVRHLALSAMGLNQPLMRKKAAEVANRIAASLRELGE